MTTRPRFAVPVQMDMMVYNTPTSLGGQSSALKTKCFLDALLQNCRAISFLRLHSKASREREGELKAARNFRIGRRKNQAALVLFFV